MIAEANPAKNLEPKTLGHIAGLSLLGSIIIGLLASLTVGQGIDINLSADVVATARNMIEAEAQLRAKAYIGLATFALAVVFGISLFLLLRKYGPLLAPVSLIVSLAAAILSLFGSVYALNAAEIVGNIAYTQLASETQRLLLSGLQATSDYTSFHLSLVLSSTANAGFFYLFWRSGLIPRPIAGWGVFASLFVASMIVARDFIPMLSNNYVTGAFMLSNLIALVSTGIYLSIKGVRSV